MYNPEMKQRFIDEHTTSSHTQMSARVLFNATEPYETNLGMDICAMSTDKLQPVIDDVLGVRTRGKYTQIIMLREYVAWCRLAKYPGVTDSIRHVSILGLGKIRKQMVSSPFHLQQYFNAVFDPESDETIDNIYRCYLWLAYGGVSREAALDIKTSDVHLDTLSVECQGKEVPIYREALPAFRNAVVLTSFFVKHPNYVKPVGADRVPGDRLMRGVKANAQLLTISSTLSKRFAEAAKAGRTELQLSYYKIWLSGVFYRMYELERSGSPVDFSGIVAEEMSEKTYSTSERDSLRQRQRRKEKDYAEDYLRWKLAFFV